LSQGSVEACPFQTSADAGALSIAAEHRRSRR
jgi:hypothetical protein